MRRLINCVKKKKLLKETIWSFLSKGVAMLLYILFTAVVARRLGSERYGEWSMFLSIVTVFGSFSYLGVNKSVQKYIAEHNGTDEIKVILKESLLIRLIISGVFSLLIIALWAPVTQMLNGSSLRPLAYFGAALVFFSGTVEFVKAIFVGLHRIKYNFIVSLIEFGTKLAIVIVIFTVSVSIAAVAWSFSLSLILATLVGSSYLYRDFYRKRVSGNYSYFRKILSYSLPLAFVSLGWVALTEIDTLMVGHYLSAAEVGQYAAAKQIINKMSHISVAIAMGTMAVFAKVTDENRMAMRSKLTRIVKITTLLHVALAVAIALAAGAIVQTLFGSEYKTAVLPLQILTVFMVLSAVSTILCAYLDYVGLAKLRARNMVLTIIIVVIADVIMIPRYGINGAAIATSLSYLPYVVINWIETRRALKFNDIKI